MRYNNGFSQDNFYDAQADELMQRARDYSEGNKDLELTLLNLWKQGVHTIGCCIGHAEDDPKYTNSIGYFAFKLDNPNSFKYLNMIYKVYEELKVEDISIIIDESSASIHFPYKFSNIIFNMLNELSKVKISDYNDKMYINQIMAIMNFANIFNMSFEYVIEHGKILIAVYNEDDEKMKNAEVKDLILPIDDCNAISFPFIVECNHENLEKINLLINNYMNNHLTNDVNGITRK